MNKSKISIIIPVYNSENTINRCIDSLLKQTYKNFEIIVINDGSTDKTLKIINDYQKKHNNIFVYSQKNSGAGEARNNGLKKAKGKYVTFVDSDDTLCEFALENMTKHLNDDTDIVVSGFKKIDSNNNILFEMIPENNYWTELKFTATVFKLYKKSFLTRNMIKYPKFEIFEDLCFSLSSYTKTNNIAINNNSDYIIHKNSHSITSTLNNKPCKDCIDALKFVNNLSNISKYDNKVLQFFYMKTLILNIIIQLDGHCLNQLNKIYVQDYKYIKSINLCGKKIRFHWEKYETNSLNLFINLFIFFTKLRLNKFLIFILKKIRIIRVK